MRSEGVVRRGMLQRQEMSVGKTAKSNVRVSRILFRGEASRGLARLPLKTRPRHTPAELRKTGACPAERLSCRACRIRNHDVRGVGDCPITR